MGKSADRRDKIFDAEVSKRLRDAIPERQIEETAKAAKMDPSTIHRWMVEPPRVVGDFKRIAEFLKVPAGELVFGDERLTKEEKTSLEILAKNPTLSEIISAVQRASSLASEPPKYVPSPLYQSVLEQARRTLDQVLIQGPASLPSAVYEQLKTVQTALHQLDAPQVSICQHVQVLEGS